VTGRGFLNPFISRYPYPPGADIKINKGSSPSEAVFCIASQLEKAGSTVYIVVSRSQFTKDEKTYLVDIIEQTALVDHLNKVNVDAMRKGIKANGKIVLYEIYFGTNNSELKSESKPTLFEIQRYGEPILN
jgi:OmpA-OmpF porin, OOP family